MRTHPLRSSFWNVLLLLDDQNEALENVDKPEKQKSRVYNSTGGEFADKIDKMKNSLSMAKIKIWMMSSLAQIIVSYNDKIDFKSSYSINSVCPSLHLTSDTLIWL